MFEGRKRQFNGSGSKRPSVILLKREFPISGQTIVELNLLAKELEDGCNFCKKPLCLYKPKKLFRD